MRISFKVARVVNYICDSVVRDIKIAVYLESPRKINFNLASYFLNEWIFSKNRVLAINNKVVIYLDLWQNICKSIYKIYKTIIASLTPINSFSCFFWKVLNNSPGFIIPGLKKCRIRIKTLVAVPHLLVNFKLI